MSDPISPTRRMVMAGIASASVVEALPATARAQTLPARREALSARSSDGVTLIGSAQGNPSSPEILFIHGLRQSQLSWDRQFADPTLARFRMVRFDLRGHGDSDKPDALLAYSDLSRWGDDVAAMIAAAKMRRPILVGWSLGGAVIGGYLQRHGAKDIAGINLVDAVTKFTPEFLTPLSGEFARRTASHDLAERATATAEFLRACFEQPPTGQAFEALLAINGMTARSVTEGLGHAQADLDPVFRDYRGPLLVTHGDKDRLLNVAIAEHNVRLHPGAKLSIYPKAGHAPFYEDHLRFNRELAAFVMTTG